MIPFGLALEKTGAAAELAGLLINTFQGVPPIFLLGIILLLAVMLTQLIENAAVAIILAPLAYGWRSAPVRPQAFYGGTGSLCICGFLYTGCP